MSEHPLDELREIIEDRVRAASSFGSNPLTRMAQGCYEDCIKDVDAFIAAHPGLRDYTMPCCRCEKLINPDSNHRTSWAGLLCHACYSKDKDGIRLSRFGTVCQDCAKEAS